MSRRLDRFLQRLQRDLTLGPGFRPRTARPPMAHPGERIPSSRTATAAGIVVAIVVPFAFGAALIPARDHITQSISLVMVIPVLLVAVTTGARIAALAALSGALVFDVFHTMPYYRFTIDDPDDIVEMIILLCVGVITGLVTESAQRAIASARVRQRELNAVTDFIGHVHRGDPHELVAHAQRGIEQLLLPRQCRWHPGYHGTAAAVLTATGTVATGVYTDSRDTATNLPANLEIPVGTPPHEHGRFVLRASDAGISVEERRAAATIAAALGRALDMSSDR